MRFLSPPQGSSLAASTSNVSAIAASDDAAADIDSENDQAKESSDEEPDFLVPKNLSMLEATDVYMEPQKPAKKRARAKKPKGTTKKHANIWELLHVVISVK